MRNHQIFGGNDNEFYVICDITDVRGEYVNPAKNVVEVDPEVNDVCILNGDKVFMGEMPHGPTFFLVDGNGNISFFNRFHTLKLWAAERWNGAVDAADDDYVEFPAGEFPPC